MPVTELPVPVYPPTYQQENFAFVKVWDRRLTELHQVPRAQYQGPPQDMVERTFARFETPWEVTLPETARTWKILETLEDGTQWVMTVGPHFQSHRLPPLNRTEANTSDRMCLSFQIRPCKTSAKSMHLVNSFMYHDESIVQVYEGAGWAFPVETLEDTFMMRIHFQGFEILQHTHFPSNFPHHVNLEKSLTPNWLPPAEFLNNPRHWTTRKFVPWTSDWNKAFDAQQRHLFKYSKTTAHKAQRRLQCLIKAAKTEDELDAIYEAVRGGAGRRRCRAIAEKGEEKRRLQEQS